MAMMVGTEVFHAGFVLCRTSAYMGDEVNHTGCYYWNPETNTVEQHLVDDIYRPVIVVDAPDNIVDAADTFVHNKVKGYIPEILASMNEDRAATLTIGDKVVVTGGRKVKKGTEGVVFWIGDSGYGVSAGVRFSDTKDARGRYVDAQFIQPRFLKIVNPPTFSLTDAQVEEVCYHVVSYGWDRLRKNTADEVKRVLNADKD
jgi:hypothetical protein